MLVAMALEEPEAEEATADSRLTCKPLKRRIDPSGEDFLAPSSS